MAHGKAFDTLRDCSPTISVGILTADLMNLSSEVALLEGTDIRVLHFDVMDGCFSPVMTVGPPFIKAVKTDLLKDVHLMIADPREKTGDYVDAGADIITIHLEACNEIQAALRDLGTMENRNDPERGLIRGVALTPDTPVDLIQPLLDDIEMIVLLAVNPRVKGFPFFDGIGDKFARLKELASTAGKDILLCIDGGVKRNNVAWFAEMGAHILVSGSAVFDGKGPVENARFMLNTVKSHTR